MSARMRQVAEAVGGVVFVLGVCTVVPVMLFVPVLLAVYPSLTV